MDEFIYLTITMRYSIQFKPYRRSFRMPVRLGQFVADFRVGIIIKLADQEGHFGFGEIAPLESFGSESVEKAHLELKSLHGLVTESWLRSIDASEYPCLLYAVKSALKDLQSAKMGDLHTIQTSGMIVKFAGLIQRKQVAELTGKEPWWQDQSVLKLKIAGSGLPIRDELENVERICRWCRFHNVKLRLDANEQLDLNTARICLDTLSPYADVVEFLEQPLDRWYLDELLGLSNSSVIPIAIDEGLQMLHQQLDLSDDLKRMVFIVKPSLGDERVIEKLSIPEDRIVYSSVFETAIGFSQLLRKAPFCRIPGFDTQGVFSDNWSYPKEGNFYRLGFEFSEKIWREME